MSTFIIVLTLFWSDGSYGQSAAVDLILGQQECESKVAYLNETATIPADAVFGQYTCAARVTIPGPGI